MTSSWKFWFWQVSEFFFIDDVATDSWDELTAGERYEWLGGPTSEWLG